MIDLVALGEALIDFTQDPTLEGEPIRYTQHPGGAPANVLAMAARLGKSTAFIGCVGKDAFGAFLKETMVQAGIDIQGLVSSPRYPTTLAFIHSDEHKDPSFSFYREGAADIHLSPKDLPLALLKKTRIFHFGSLSLTHDPARKATLEALDLARGNGSVISYDPNYRATLWASEKKAQESIASVLARVDILKVSQKEMVLLTGEEDWVRGSSILMGQGPRLVLVTRGGGGAFFRNRRGYGRMAAFPVRVLDTTGAGDAFMGSFLSQFLETGKAPENLSPKELAAMVRFANASGGLTTTRPGALSALPTQEELNAFVAEHEKEAQMLPDDPTASTGCNPRA
ncbi:Fructokinase [Clostridiaceae bacterium JG1575]|nr:Fructokinase [Clostridiaceae bacterium JG1575]